MLSIRKKISLGFGLVGLITCFVIFEIYFQYSKLHNSGHRIQESGARMLELESFLNTMRSIESGNRGFILSGQNDFLEPYSSAIPKIKKHLTTIDSMYDKRYWSPNTSIYKLHTLTLRHIEFGKLLVATRLSSGQKPAEELIHSRIGIKQMDSVIRIVHQMRANEDILLARILAEDDLTYRNVVFFSAGAGILCLLLIIMTYFAVSRSIYHPIVKLMKGTKVLRKGDFSYRIVIDPRDELAQLSESFNDMANQLELAQSEIQRKNEILLHESKLLKNSNKQLLNAHAELTALNNALSATNQELEALHAEQNEFLGIAAHDLKNPIAQILLIANTIKLQIGEIDHTEILRYLRNIESLSYRMNRIIMNLLQIKEIETLGINLTLKSLDLGQIAKKAGRIYCERANAKDISIEFRSEENVLIETDADAATSILDNIISNAIKYTSPGKKISITIRKSGTEGIAEIIDGGPGFTEEDRKNLFEKFTRLSARPTGGEHSTGLGLYIVKKFADLTNTRISIENAEGAGAKFIIKFPLASPTDSFLTSKKNFLLSAE